MELFRPANAITSISFPMADATGFALTGLGTLTSTWVAWSDDQPANTNGNPGFQNTANSFTEIAKTAVYAGKVAAAELPVASPYVLFRFSGTQTDSQARVAATQYLLIRTASLYANLVGLKDAPLATAVTAGYMPVDVKQVVNLSAPADNSIEKALARMYFATTYLDAAVSGVPTLASALNLTNPADNTLGKALARMYMATHYLDAAVSTRSAPATAQTIDQTTALNLVNPADNTIGKALSRMYMATGYLDAAISSRSTYAGADTAGTTTLLTRIPGAITLTLGAVNLNEAQALTIPAGATGTLGQALVNMKYATVYLDAAVSTRSAPATAQTINQTTALDASADNSIGKTLARLYHATDYLDAQISAISGLGLSTALNLSNPADNTVGKALSQMYFATRYLDAAVSSRSAPATAQTIDQTTALDGSADNSIGKTLLRLYHATDYLDAQISTISGLGLATALNLTNPADNTVGKALSQMYFATAYLDAAVSSVAGMTLSTALNLTNPADNTVGKLFSRMYFATQYLDAAISSIAAAADPWLTPIPGAYVAGTAGHRLGNVPDVAAGAAGGIFIAGTNAATSITGTLTADVTGNVSGSVGSVTIVADKTGYRLSSAGVGDVITTALAESYASDGAAPTLAQLLFMIWSLLAEKSIASTTLTAKKLDGTTTAMTFTLNDPISPSSITRTT